MSAEVILVAAPELDLTAPGNDAGNDTVETADVSLIKEPHLLYDLLRTPARRALPLILLAAAPAAAQAQQTPTTQQREHIVRPGDTLWDLARAYLMNPYLWPLIYEANRNVVANPHWIYPAERIIIPGLEPRQQQQPLGITPPAPLPEPAAAEPAQEPTVAATLDLRRPVVALAEYRAAPWLSTAPEREVSGRIIRVVDPAGDEDRLPTTLHPQQRVHIGSLSGRLAMGDSLVVVRFGRGVGPYGRIVEPLAVLQVDEVHPTVVTARVVRQFGDAKVGDVVMPLGRAPDIALGVAEDAETGLQGNLLEFFVPEPLHGTADVAFVSLGSAHGLGIGDELAVYVPARPLDNERPEVLPPTTVATVRVIRVDPGTATVRVLSVNSTALRDGLPVRVVRRMP